MTRIELADHELNQPDFSNFELSLQTKGAIFAAERETWTNPTGGHHVRLNHPAVDFDEARCDGGEIGSLLDRYGFHQRRC